MNEINITDMVRECQSSANIQRRPHSLCMFRGRMIVELKTKAIENGLEIIETCNPVYDPLTLDQYWAKRLSIVTTNPISMHV